MNQFGLLPRARRGMGLINSAALVPALGAASHPGWSSEHHIRIRRQSRRCYSPRRRGQCPKSTGRRAGRGFRPYGSSHRESESVDRI